MRQDRNRDGGAATCHHCGKVAYLDRKAARLARRRNPWLGRLNAYQCGPWWHLGHLDDRVRHGQVTREIYR